MDREGRGEFGRFERVQEFLTQHPLADAPASLGAQAIELNEVIAELSSDAVNQEIGGRFATVHTKAHRSLRAELYTKQMKPISRVARQTIWM